MRRGSIRVRVVAQCVLLLAAAGIVAACGSNLTQRQIDEPCTRTAQCDAGLVCLTGVCQPDPEAGAGGAGGSPSGS